MLIEWEYGEKTILVRNVKAYIYIFHMIIYNIFQIHNFLKQKFILKK